MLTLPDQSNIASYTTATVIYVMLLCIYNNSNRFIILPFLCGEKFQCFHSLISNHMQLPCNMAQYIYISSPGCNWLLHNVTQSLGFVWHTMSDHKHELHLYSFNYLTPHQFLP